MNKLFRIAFATAIVLSVSSCWLFTAKSDFYVDNQSSQEITVAWTTIDGEQDDTAIPAGTRTMLTSAELMESDKVLPSQALAKLTISVGSSIVHTQDPIDDEEWEENAGTGSKEYTFDLVVTDSMLP